VTPARSHARFAADTHDRDAGAPLRGEQGPTTGRREALLLWAAVVATLALVTALGDLAADTWGLRNLASGIMFAVLIVLPVAGHRWLGLNAVAAFWISYGLTRPLGASRLPDSPRPRRTLRSCRAVRTGLTELRPGPRRGLTRVDQYGRIRTDHLRESD
jgi:hypothetical protein